MPRLLRVLEGSYARALATVVSGNTLAQALPLLILPLLTRLFSLESFGLYSVWLGIASIAGTCLSGRMENAVAAEPVPAARHGIVGAIAIVSASIAFLAAVAAAAVLALTEVSGASEVRTDTWILAAPVGLLLSVTMVRQQLGLTFGQYRAVAALRVVTAGSTVIAQVLLAMTGWRTAESLIVGYAIGVLIGAVATTRAIPLRSGTWQEAVSFKTLRDFLLKYRDYYRYSAPAALMIVVAGHLPLIVVGLRFGPESAALVSIVFRAILSPTVLIRGALGELYRQRAGSLYGRTGSFRDEYIRTVRIAIVLAVLPVALVAAGPDLFGLVFGEKWRPASEYAWLLLPLLATGTVAAPLASTLLIANRNLEDLYVQSALLLATLAAMLLTSSARDAILSYSISYAALLLVQMFVGYRASRPRARLL